MADAVITFVIEFSFLIMLFRGTLDELEVAHLENNQGAIPPISSTDIKT